MKTSKKSLAHLKVCVGHILNRWPAVLQRQHYLRSMSQSETLRSALSSTYAGHVFNALHTVLSLDLIRAIGSSILDRTRDTASLHRAVHALRDREVLREISAEYCSIAPTRFADAAAAEAIARHRSREVADLLAMISTKLDEIDVTVFETDLAKLIQTIRHNSVAHDAVIPDGDTWKMWSIECAGLTYRQLDEYTDVCTRAVDAVARIVLRNAFSFDDVPRVSQRYADDFIEALVFGLNHQREAREVQRGKNFAEVAAMYAALVPKPHGG